MRCLVLVVCSWLLLASSAYAGFDEGVAALKRADFAAALAELRPAAEQGNALAQVYVGSLYENGRGIDKDLAQAAAWYRKAADQNLAAGQYSLGMLYVRGAGVPQDNAIAAEWFRKAAEQGVANA